FDHAADDSVTGNLEDRRILVFVDGDDCLGGAHAGEVLDRAGNSDRDVELGTDEPAGLTDLVAVRSPAIVGYSAGRANCRIPERRGQLFDELEILRCFQPASSGDDHWRLGEIQLASTSLFR